VRPFIFVLHKYLGLFIGLYFIVITLTGALLILLENPIDNFLDYPVVHVHAEPKKQPLMKMLQTVEIAYPHGAIRHILKSCERGCTYDFTIRRGADDHIDVLVDPYTARIVKASLWSTTPVGFMYSFHANLFAGDTGSRVNAFVSLVAILLAITGLYLWPGWRKLRNAFAIKWDATVWRWNFDVHKIVGFTCALFFIYIVITGIATVLINEPEISPPQVTKTRALHPRLDLDNLVAIADRALPGRITMIYPPATSTAPLRIRKVVPGDPDPYGWSYVSVNPSSGALIEKEDTTKWPLLWRVYTYFYPLHIGSVGGYPLRFLYVILALAPLILYTTGFLMWLDRLRRDEQIVLARASS